MIRLLRTTLYIFFLFSPGLSVKAQHTHFQTGDIFLGLGGGIIQWRDSNKVLIKTINTGDAGGNGNGTGLRIHPLTGKLWVTNSNLTPGSTNGIRIINTDGSVGGAINISMYQKTPTSITFDKPGNAYIGGLWNDNADEIVKINSAGTAILDHFPVSSDGYVWGAEWVEMDCNDSIIYYTTLRERVKRYNVVTHQQLPDYANLTGSVSWLFAMRLLRDNSMLVVTADHSVKRLNTSGAVIKTYGPTNTNSYFGLAVTPDEKSFWVGGLAFYGPMHKYDIASGQLLDSFMTSPNQGVNVHGIAIYGDEVKNCFSTAPAPIVVKKNHVYPNPGNGNFSLQTDFTGKITVRLFSRIGQPVYQKEYNLTGNNNKIPFNLLNLPAGVYYLQLISEKEVRLQKIVIN